MNKADETRERGAGNLRGRSGGVGAHAATNHYVLAPANAALALSTTDWMSGNSMPSTADTSP